jgi:hypothetical protein
LSFVQLLVTKSSAYCSFTVGLVPGCESRSNACDSLITRFVMTRSLLHYCRNAFALTLLSASAAISFAAYPNPLGPEGADPGVLWTGSTYYVYTTSGNGTGAMPIKWSNDLLSWTDNGTRVFPIGQFPAWVNGGSYWAPETHLIAGRYVCYYAAKGADG